MMQKTTLDITYVKNSTFEIEVIDIDEDPELVKTL